MPNIQVDDQIFAFLQKQAVPFVDDPNSVLRRLLLPELLEPIGEQEQHKTKGLSYERDDYAAEPIRRTEPFVSEVLHSHFGNDFEKKSPYRYLFESPKYLVYFQNFNQIGSDALWYRLRGSALGVLRGSRKDAIVCLTNPSDNLFYAIPVAELDRRVRQADWGRNDLEVNIDHDKHLWRELDWNIGNYLHRHAV